MCRVQQWSFRPDVAQIVLYQQRPMPTADDFRGWTGELRGLGYTRLRTSAVTTDVWRDLDAIGMRPVQELALLEHDDPGAVRAASRHRPRTRRLRLGDHPTASAIDRFAFDDGWAIDETAIHDVCTATPHHRARWIAAPDVTGRADTDRHVHPMAGYAITGRDGTQGFLQRLAVDPAHQRRGLARALVVDSLHWLARRGARRALVNTPTHNEAALALYEGTGFRVISERLRVYEQDLA